MLKVEAENLCQDLGMKHGRYRPKPKLASMAIHQDAFPGYTAVLFLVYVGMETDLIFTRGVDLTGFASYTLLSQ